MVELAEYAHGLIAQPRLARSRKNIGSRDKSSPHPFYIT
jgi:hypothetical protein